MPFDEDTHNHGGGDGDDSHNFEHLKDAVNIVMGSLQTVGIKYPNLCEKCLIGAIILGLAHVVFCTIDDDEEDDYVKHFVLALQEGINGGGRMRKLVKNISIQMPTIDEINELLKKRSEGMQ